MSNQPHSNEQLASLLIDGRLTGADLASANQRLASDPQFAEEVNALRAQRELFALLPNFKTPDDFSDRALESSIDQVRAIVGELHFHKSDSSDSELPTPASLERKNSYTWRTAVAAVASLAGMILLTLFVFPQAFEPPHDVAVRAGATESEMDSISDSPMKSDLNKSSELKKGMVLESDNMLDDDQAQFAGKGGGGFGGGAQQVFQQVPPGSRARNQNSNVQSTQTIIDEVNNKQLASNAANGLTAMPGGFSGTPMSLPSRKKDTTKPAAVEQIWYVDMDDPKEALTSVGEVLLTNEIDVQFESRQSVQSKANLVNDKDFEAVFVNTTPSQMKQALIALSNSGEISSYPIGVSGADAATQVANNESPSKAQAQIAAPQQQALPESIKFNDQKRSLAQQLVLQPLNRGSRTHSIPPIPSSNDPALNPLEEIEMAEKKLAANETLPEKGMSRPKTMGGGGGRGGAGGGGMEMQTQKVAAPPISKEQEKSFDPWFKDADTDQELRQYLILVRTPKTESAGPAKNAMPMPASEASSEIE